MTTQEIINSGYTKTKKAQMLFELGYTRNQVSRMLNIGYGFAQNIYAAKYPERIRHRTRRLRYRPNNFNRKFGVEIECYGVSKRQLCDEINRLGVPCSIEGYNHSTRAHWKIVTDSSIEGTRGDECEIVSPPLDGIDGLEQLEKVCEALRTCRALINKTCGLHIHFDANTFSLKTWKNIYKNYINFEPTIDSMMPRSRRGNDNNYCLSLLNKFRSKNQAFSKIDAATNIEGISRAVTLRDRYYKINAESFFRHGTIEFRQHSGTREFSKIKNWILFLHRLMDYSEQGFVSSNGDFDSMKTFMQEENHDFYHNRIMDLAA